MAEKPEGRFLTKEGSPPEWCMPKVGFWAGQKPSYTVKNRGRAETCLCGEKLRAG